MSSDLQVGLSLTSDFWVFEKRDNRRTIKIRFILHVSIDSLSIGPTESLSTRVL